MTQLDERYVETLKEALTAFLNRTSELADTNGHSYAANSLAATEGASAAREESIVTACSIGDQLIKYSDQHISAFVKTITEPIEPLACWTCIRSMLESCAISAWLLDPRIDAERRISRVFAMRYEGMEQQLKYGRCIKRPESDMQELAVRIDDVEQIAIDLGYARVLNSRGQRTGIGERMPNATELIRSELDEEDMYRLLSAVAHGHSWAIMQLGFKPTSAAGSAPQMGSTPMYIFEKQVYVAGLAYLGVHGARALARALWNQYQYMGWNQLALEEVLEDVFDILQAKPTVRFWRSV